MAEKHTDVGNPVGKLVVLLCGVPGSGKDAVGREGIKQFPKGVAMSQDEHGGNWERARSVADRSLASGVSPLLVLRNGVDSSDRLPYVHMARQHGYRVVAAYPAELSREDQHRRAAMYLVAASGCYCRLTTDGQGGHETLTVKDGITVPAQVCMSFLKGFRIPAAPNEVDAVLPIHFLREDVDVADTALLKNVANQLYKNQMPDAVRKCLQESVSSAQRHFEGFAAMRRPLEELVEELRLWMTGEMEVAGATVAGPSVTDAPVPGKGETRNLQRQAKIRSAVEHLVSPANIAKCRASGSTVTNCVWLPVNTGEGWMSLEDRPLRRAAWPANHFCGAPMLQKLKATETEVLEAAQASHAAGIPLQAGDDGACVEVLDGEDTEGQVVPYLISQVDPLPEASLFKLKCPALVPE
mmetsp:Transcript_14817/g.29219  ORF Transcript_14817/g.29219 Transcript_14817/m.29219 type:complete len:411 (+) Transcript_14817:62-1294(+)